ncbi:acyl-coenzyme A thioesterase 4 isoform X2 [Eurytemora carolleeae]|uniref:acyl-coenzyme A thioesterase 4 isoform X2 n=1 Tax=Eurytemora carolleeae TaxID=1294199 RepID=UPI000C7882A7|nr:acyl-coenzyme A thioesterase 4 isoform X2 [Eurytemora carolleeae]|eukprot:XP_023323427.1 acyl-coenzyme A thioesterase 4-like isoform X2 [Eurytemora affinis]
MKLMNIMCGLPKLSVYPKHSLMTKPICVSGKNLPPNSEIKLKTTLFCQKNRYNFTSLNLYKTTNNGFFSTSTHPTLDGSQYTGCHPSGPVWSVRPQDGSRKRLWNENTSLPLTYIFKLFDSQNNLIGESSLIKYIKSPEVTRIGVSNGRFRGALYLPRLEKVEGGRRAIITIFGGMLEGRAPEDMAAMLAGSGFVTFALAFYGGEGQPSEYTHVDIEDCVDFLRSLPQVEDKRINLFGISKGADLSLCTAAFLGNKIRGTVAVNSFFGSFNGDTFYKNESVKWNGLDMKILNKGITSDQYCNIIRQFKEDPDKWIPVERVDGPILAIKGLDDVTPTIEFAQIAQQRAKSRGKTNFEVIKYTGLGHLLEPANYPVCTSARLFGWDIQYGGKNIQRHALAQLDAWGRILHFMNAK